MLRPLGWFVIEQIRVLDRLLVAFCITDRPSPTPRSVTALAKSPDIITAKALLAALKKDEVLSGMFPLLNFA